MIENENSLLGKVIHPPSQFPPHYFSKKLSLQTVDLTQ